MKNMTSEKIRTGQCFLYHESGLEAMVIEIVLKETIDPQLLQSAVEKGATRFDYLLQSLTENDGDFYLMPNDRPLVVRHDANFLPLGSLQTNYHLLDVHYEGKRLFIDYHHGLCDGRGIMPFVKTVLYYYLTQKNKLNISISGVQLADSPLLPNELKEPGYVKLGQVAQMPEVEKKGHVLAEASHIVARPTVSYVTNLEIDAVSFMRFAKSINATPSIAVSLLMSKAIDNLRGDKRSPVVANLVMDLRAGLGLENTYRNLVSSIELPYNNASQSLENLAVEYRTTLNSFKAQPNMLREANKVIGMSDYLDTLTGYEAKKAFLSFFETLRTDTYIVSYIGRLGLQELENDIATIHTYTSGTPGMSVEMIAMNRKFNLSVMQSFANKRYIDEFMRLVQKNNVDIIDFSDKEVTVPKDQVMKW